MSIEERIGLCSHCLCDTTRFCHTDCHAYSKYRGAVEQKEIDYKEFKEYLKKIKIECLRTAKIVYAYDMSSAGELEIKAKCYDEIINELLENRI